MRKHLSPSDKVFQIVGTEIEVDDSDNMHYVDYESDSGWIYGCDQWSAKAMGKATKLLRRLGYRGQPRVLIYQSFSY